jgi:hypothetical protein
LSGSLSSFHQGHGIVEPAMELGIGLVHLAQDIVIESVDIFTGGFDRNSFFAASCGSRLVSVDTSIKEKLQVQIVYRIRLRTLQRFA